MGSDELFKKRRSERKERKHDFRSPKANSFLIVTEGERTEPLYFAGLKHKIEAKIGGNISIIGVPMVDIKGEGASTVSLVEIADAYVKKANIVYQNVWVVFDKDDFDDFDLAIKIADRKGYRVAWSNQSFEYWLYLHFCYSDSALDRHDWNVKLSEIFRKKTLKMENIVRTINSYMIW